MGRRLSPGSSLRSPSRLAETAAVDVVVPVAGAGEDFARCAESLLRWTNLHHHRLVVVLDGPQDQAVAAAVARLRAAAGPGLSVFAQPQRQGFVSSANRGVAASEGDVILLNSDTIVTAGWLEKLAAAAASRDDVATVTPFSNHATICSLPVPLIANELPAGFDVDSFGQRVEACSARAYPTLPTGVGFCLYVTRAAIARVGRFDEARFGPGYGEEVDFCLRATRLGFVHLLDDATFVYHAGQKSFGDRRHKLAQVAERTIEALHPGYRATIARFIAEDPLRPVRERVTAALALAPPRRGPLALALETSRHEGPASAARRALDHLRWGRPHEQLLALASRLKVGQAPPRANVLHLAANPARPWLGGVEAQLALRARELGRRESFALVAREAGRFVLTVRSPGGLVRQDLGAAPPPGCERLESPELVAAVRAAAARVGAELVHVENLAGLPAGALLHVGESFPLVLSSHDFAAFCPRANLIDRVCGEFCDYATDLARCGLCLGLPAGRGELAQTRFRAIAASLLAAARAVVYPSSFLRRRHLELFPGLAAERQHVIPPWLPPCRLPPRKSQGPTLHLAFVGQVAPHKGSRVFAAFAAGFSAEERLQIRLSAYGGGEARELAALRRSGVAVRGYHRFGQLGQRLRADGVDLALLPSIVPETYSLCFDECRAAVVPVLAFDLGALGERIRAEGGGWLVAPAAGAAGLLARLRTLPARHLWPTVPPPPAGPPPAGPPPAELYRALYRAVLGPPAP